jgi:hypothetical protein
MSSTWKTSDVSSAGCGLFVFSLGGRLKCGSGGGVRVSDGKGCAVLMPVGAFAVDCIFEGVFVVIEAC